MLQNPLPRAPNLYTWIQDTVHSGWFSKKQYVYEPLVSQTSIRILKLLPGSKGDNIRCELFVTAREDAPQYEALSYCWGDPSNKRVVVCSGRKLMVSANLCDLLRRVRDPLKFKYLWVDAICINQSDLKEVEHQVRQMAFIYSAAERVLACLGVEDAFGYLAENEKPITLLRRSRASLDGNIDAKGRRPSVEMIVEDADMHASFSALAELLSRSWFHRLWVIQEAGLARLAILLFGNQGHEIDLDDLIPFVQKLSDDYGDIASYYHITVWAATFASFGKRKHIRDAGLLARADFLDMLERTITYGASDPRDFVFGLLGHPSAQTGNGLIIEPNYHKSRWQIHHELAFTLLTQSQDLRVFSGVRHRNEDEMTRDYPSWVPTWERTQFIRSLGVLLPEHDRWDAHAGLPRKLQMIEGNKLLKVEGFAFDMIEEYSDEFLKVSKTCSPGESTIEKWPLEATLGLQAFHAMETEEKLHELSEALLVGRPFTSSPSANGFAAFRVELSRTKAGPKDIVHCALLPEGPAAAEEAAQAGNARIFFSR